jgi:DNA-binding transcriptional ArsR family regulator
VKDHEHVLGALADPTRRKIFEGLELAAGLPVSRPAVSQHLKVLRLAGLVQERRQGTRNIYSIDPRGLDPLRAYLEEFWGGVLAAFEEAADEKMGG